MCAATVIGIVYSKAQGVIRARIDTRMEPRYIGELHEDGKPKHSLVQGDGDDSHLVKHMSNMQDGEAWATIPCDLYDSWIAPIDRHRQCHAYLGLQGSPGIDDHYAVLDVNGVELGTHLLDPEIDAPYGKFKHPEWHKFYHAKCQNYSIVRKVG